VTSSSRYEWHASSLNVNPCYLRLPPSLKNLAYLKYAAGLCDRMHLFSAGVTLGILSCCLSNKKELEALKGTLKRMENLVQDLQDELEMKGGLTVKESHNETSIDHEGKVSII
jgi:hypothetical protein